MLKTKEHHRKVRIAGVALAMFAVGCGIFLVGLSQGDGTIMLLAGIVIIASGGVAALFGDLLSWDFVRDQGGGEARRAREADAHRKDTTQSDLVVPDDWGDPPER